MLFFFYTHWEFHALEAGGAFGSMFIPEGVGLLSATALGGPIGPHPRSVSFKVRTTTVSDRI